MAEALAIFGGVAAGVALVKEFTKVSRALRGCAGTIAYAKGELQSVADEASIFADILFSFSETVGSRTGAGAKENGGQKGAQEPVGPGLDKRKIRLGKKLIRWSQSALDGLRDLLKKVRSMKRSGTFSMAKLMAHTRWYFGKDTLKCLQVSLSVARESMSIFLQLLVLEEMRRPIPIQPTGGGSGSESDLEDAPRLLNDRL
jgi:hypothetical protein